MAQSQSLLSQPISFENGNSNINSETIKDSSLSVIIQLCKHTPSWRGSLSSQPVLTCVTNTGCVCVEVFQTVAVRLRFPQENRGMNKVGENSTFSSTESQSVVFKKKKNPHSRTETVLFCSEATVNAISLSCSPLHHCLLHSCKNSPASA